MFSEIMAIEVTFIAKEPEAANIDSDTDIIDENIVVLVGEKGDIPSRFGKRGGYPFDKEVKVEFHNTAPKVTAWCHDIIGIKGPEKVTSHSNTLNIEDKGRYVITTSYNAIAHKNDPKKNCELKITKEPKPFK